MAYKRYIKRGKNIYGPYVYHSRKEGGKVISEYKGKEEKKKKLKLILGGIFILLLLLFVTYNFIKTPTTGFLTHDEESESDDLAFIRFVIELTKAEHLDNNRQFISDIYNGVKSLDDVWSEEIPNGDYVRVTFEEELTSESDITIYPRIVSGTPKIEVYEADQSEIIAEFNNIISNEYNKVFLTNLQGSQDTFDLMVLDGSIEIEHIVDPSDTIPINDEQIKDILIQVEEVKEWKISIKSG